MFGLAAIVAYLRGRKAAYLVLLALAATTKALLALPATMILAWTELARPALDERRLRPTHVLRWLASSAVVALPFVVWLVTLDAARVPNPFDLSHGLAGRHSGSWDLLGTPAYWTRCLTFLGTVGLGWPLFLGALWALPSAMRRLPQASAADALITVWAMSAVPMWLLARRGSFIHDYYVLTYAVPWALLGARAWLASPFPRVAAIALVANIAIGLAQPLALKPASPAPTPEALCSQEAPSYARDGRVFSTR